MVGGVGVPDVLCGLEYSEGERGEEVPSGEQTSSGAQGESGVLPQEVTDFLQLGDTVRHEDFVGLEHGEYAPVLDARVLGHEVQHGVEHPSPGLVLALGVVNMGDSISVFVSECDFGNILPPLAVYLIGEPGVVHVQLGLVLGHQMVALVEVCSVLGEPRVLDGHVVFVKKIDSHEGGGLPECADELQKVGAGHIDGHEDIELDSIGLGRPGLQVTDGALVVVYGL